MTTTATDTDYHLLAQPFRPIFDRIAAGNVAREHQRILPGEAIRWLKEAGFGALRIAKIDGGAGATLPQLLQLFTELAEADANVPQALRGHFAFVEDLLNQPDSPRKQRWLRRIVAGELLGNAWSETGSVKLGETATTVTPTASGWQLNGEKFYSTGSLFADWIDVLARRSDTQEIVIAVVSTHQPGVQREDNWDGFGQRLTGSGTTRFDNAHVDTDQVTPFSERFRYQTAFYQHVLLATLAGIARAVTRDAARGVRDRTRVYSHGNGGAVRQDAQVLQVVGEISAWSFATQASAQRAALSLQRVWEQRHRPDAEVALLNQIAEVEADQAQVVATELVPRAATHLFNALGASDTRKAGALDRHWRNARTVASHNPVIYKARIAGEWLVNGTPPVFIWQIGQGDHYREQENQALAQ
ncbi:monooxygenase [Shimwellia pseudoproteus]|uniref:acyl-CoA dehydrogenase family protein n=1 Tax=Shimwellia pseudoproteus TaxID=570012 RepID=UPI0018EB9BA1|nr:acyl-CoA dehydrogenase family protein [Shimwellia pseudoproteus]MBJ3816112.1 monooxygenase [Shimwellia pseudoproteus]